MRRSASVALALLLFAAGQGSAGLYQLYWEAPTENVDGTPLVDLAGYRVEYTFEEGSGLFDGSIDINDPAPLQIQLDLPYDQPLDFRMYAFNATSEFSIASNQLTIAPEGYVPPPPALPNSPSNFQWTYTAPPPPPDPNMSITVEQVVRIRSQNNGPNHRFTNMATPTAGNALVLLLSGYDTSDSYGITAGDISDTAGNSWSVATLPGAIGGQRSVIAYTLDAATTVSPAYSVTVVVEGVSANWSEGAFVEVSSTGALALFGTSDESSAALGTSVTLGPVNFGNGSFIIFANAGVGNSDPAGWTGEADSPRRFTEAWLENAWNTRTVGWGGYYIATDPGNVQITIDHSADNHGHSAQLLGFYEETGPQEASLTLDVVPAVSVAATADVDSFMAADIVPVLTPTATADVIASMPVDMVPTFTVTSEVIQGVQEAALTLDVVPSITATVERISEGALTLDVVPSLQVSANADRLAAVTAALVPALQAAADSVTEASFTVDKLLQLALDSSISVDGSVTIDLTPLLSSASQLEGQSAFTTNVVPALDTVAQLEAQSQLAVGVVPGVAAANTVDTEAQLASDIVPQLETDAVAEGTDEASITIDLVQAITTSAIGDLTVPVTIDLTPQEQMVAALATSALLNLGFDVTNVQVGDSGQDSALSIDVTPGLATLSSLIAEAVLIEDLVTQVIQTTQQNLTDQLLANMVPTATANTLANLSDSVALSATLTYTSNGTVAGVSLALKLGRVINLSAQNRLINLLASSRIINSGEH